MKLAQLCLTLCNPMDCSPPGSSAHEFSRQEYWSRLPCLGSLIAHVSLLNLHNTQIFSISFTVPTPKTSDLSS